MKAELRALERKFVKERATVMVHEFIDKLAYRWPQVLQGERTDTTVLDLVIELWDDDIPLPTITVTINYLGRCLRESTDPNVDALFSKMAPWSVRPIK